MGKNLLNSVKLVKPPSSVFDLTHDVKLSCNMGQLIPVMNMDCIPGDRIQVSQESLIRLAPLVSPMMHRVNVFFHCFFTPWRLLWNNFEKYATGKLVAGLPPAVPYVTLNDASYAANRMFDYLGLPDPDGTTHLVNAWHFACYNMILFEYYRDQNLQSVGQEWVGLVDGDNSAEFGLGQNIRNRAWEHDYFTACLPFAQRGDSVDLPVGSFDDVPVKLEVGAYPTGSLLDGSPTDVNVQADARVGAFADDIFAKTSDLTASAVTIRDFRRAEKLQQFLERSAVGGNRYTEQNYAMFGVQGSDRRLQRPEYITGSISPVQISEVLNTTGTDDLPQGNMAGHGMAHSNGYGGSYFCEEHGTMMCIMSVMPKTAYFQGIPRKFSKLTDRYDLFWSQFEHIGEQEVLNKEVYAPSSVPLGVFGYNPRYTEYKNEFNRVAGDFRTTLKHWTMAREFAGDTPLNEDFVVSDPTRRVFAVTDETIDTLYVHVLNRVRARRLMSKFSTPHL